MSADKFVSLSSPVQNTTSSFREKGLFSLARYNSKQVSNLFKKKKDNYKKVDT